MTTDRESREELRRLEAAATPGPWISEYSGKTGPVVIDGESQNALDHVAKCSHYRDHADAALIAAARNALPALLDAADRADAESERADAAEAERDAVKREASTLAGSAADAWEERDAARARVAELEATLARVRALMREHEAALVGRLTINGLPATATERALVEGFVEQARAALSPAQGETGVEG